jgi:hypothetical protein
MNPITDFLRANYTAAQLAGISVQRAPRYDTVRYPAAGTAGPLQFFAVPSGGVDPSSSHTKSLEDTNIETPRSLGPVAFLMTHIRSQLFWDAKSRQVSGISSDADALFSVYKDAVEAFVDIASQGVLTIKTDDKDSYEIPQPFLRCPPGFGFDITAWAASVKQSGFAYQSPVQKPMALSPLKLLKADQLINVSLAYPNATSPALTNIVASSYTPVLKLRVILDGYEIRGVK